MLIDKEIVAKAKEAISEETPDLIAELLNIDKWDSKNKKGCCPFHDENTPSFIWDKTRNCFHCFGCNRNVDVIDAYMETGMTFIQAVQKLFELAQVTYAFGESGVKTDRQYKYPKLEDCGSKEKIYEYLKLRGISKETVDKAGVTQDSEGNICFNFYDSSDVLTMVKKRPSRKINKGETKCWCQKGSDTAPLLFNMNKVNTSSPLYITEGETDCLALIEAGVTNAVSIPLGAGNTHWIEHNWDWLEQFENIVICFDNDEAGVKARKDVVPRLGTWRTKYVEIPQTYESVKVKDINEVLYRFGKEAIINLVMNASDPGVPSVVDVSEIQDVDFDEVDGIYTGIHDLDSEIMRLFYGTLTVLSGKPGCVDGDTMFFNGKKWKRIADYEEGDKVLQYNQDGTAELVTPLQYHKYPCRKFYHLFSANGVDQMLSEEHNLVYVNADNKLVKKQMSEVYEDYVNSKKNLQGGIISTFKYDPSGLDINDTELKKACLDYLVNPRKEFPLEFYNLSIRQKELLLEVIYDGEWRELCASLSKRKADFLQFLFCTTGRESLVNPNIHDIKCGFDSYYVTYTEPEDAVTALPLNDVSITVYDDLVDEYKYCFTVPSGMLVLRRNGRINITGNSGKSSFLSQLICQSLEQDKPVWMFSREMPGWMEKSWLNYIMAGGHHIKTYEDGKGAKYYKVSPEAKMAISDYYAKRWFLYRDDWSNKLDDIMASMEDSVRKFGVKLLIIDNLMMVDLGANENSELNKQTECVERLIKFAMKYAVSVVLVAHPRKMPSGEDVGIYDISGTSNIINLAHRTIGLRKIDQEKEQSSYNVCLTLIKDRMNGKAGRKINLYYDTPSRRFYTNEEEFNFQYSWDKNKYAPLPYPHSDEEVCGKC